MTNLVNVDIGAMRVRGEVAVRVGMLLGRYLDDAVLVGAVAEDVTAGWFAGRHWLAEAPTSTVEDWWSAYVELVEAAAGGVDCATDDDLRRAWSGHAQRLLRQTLASAVVSPDEPASVGGGR